MANDELTDLTELSSVSNSDVLYIVDVSDTTDSTAGTSKKITLANLVSLIDADATQTLTNKTIDGDDNTLQDIATSSLKTRSGADASVITGTAGTNGDLAQWNGDGDLVDGPTPPSGTIVGTSDTQSLSNKTFSDQVEFSEDINLATGKNVQVNDADPDMIISLPAGSWSPTTTSGCAAITTVEAGTNDIDYKVLDFDNTSDESAFINFTMPTNYDGGVIQFRYIWTTASGGASETVDFFLAGRAYADDDAIDQAVGTSVTVSDTWIADGDIHISSWSGDVTLAGSPAGGQWVHLEITRDVSEDDLGGDARLIGVQIKYKISQYSN